MSRTLGARARRSESTLVELLSARARRDGGFTLVEVLVVVLIIGVLAGIALPLFLSSPDDASDAQAKSNARNLVSHVELCHVPTDDFSTCNSQASLGGNIGIPYGSGPGQAQVVSADKNSYEVVAVSTATTAGQNHTFMIKRSINGQDDRTCTAGSSNNAGGCHAGNW